MKALWKIIHAQWIKIHHQEKILHSADGPACYEFMGIINAGNVVVAMKKIIKIIIIRRQKIIRMVVVILVSKYKQ